MDNKDGADVKVGWGAFFATFSFSSGPGKNFLGLLVIIAITCFAYSFRVNPLLTFIVFLIAAVAVPGILIWLYIYHKELFLESKFLFRILNNKQGSKKEGLSEPDPNEDLVQPVIEGKIVKEDKK